MNEELGNVRKMIIDIVYDGVVRVMFVFVLLCSFLLTITSCDDASNVSYNTQVVIDFLNRIGGDGASEKILISLDKSLSDDGKDVFIITSKNEKPFIKANSTLAMTTGINWYLNHYANINISWNNLKRNAKIWRPHCRLCFRRHLCDCSRLGYANNLSIHFRRRSWVCFN